MSERFRVGLIGLGEIAPCILRSLTNIPELEISSICTRNEETLRETASAYGISRTNTNYLDMLERNNLDIVCITTPPPLHKDMAVAAAQHRCHVAVMKPMAVTKSEEDLMIEIADKEGVKLMVLDNFRYLSEYQTAKSVIKRNLIGKPYHVRLEWFSYAAPVGWRAQQNQFILFEGGCHLFDVLNFLSDSRAEAVHAVTAHAGPPMLKSATKGENFFTATVKYASGLIGRIDWSAVAFGPSLKRGRVDGTMGSLYLYTCADGGDVEWEKGVKVYPMWGTHLSPELRQGADDWDRSFELPMREFVEAILGNREHSTSGKYYSSQVSDLVRAAYQSAESGEVVRIE